MSAAWIWRRVLLDLRRQPVAVALLALAFALSALLAATYRLGAAKDVRPRAVTPAVGPPAQVIAYLREDLERPGVHKLRDVLARLPGVQHVALVSGEEALARLRRELGERGRLLDGTDDGLLPASLEVWLSPGGDPITRAHQLAWRLQRLDGIVDADVIEARGAGAAAPDAADLSARRLWLASAIAGGAAVLLGAVFIGWRQRRDELRVLLALGFTRRALLVPAMLLASAAALVGSAAGFGVGAVGRRLAVPWFAAAGGATLLDWCAGLLLAAILGALAGVARGLGPDVIDAR